MTTRLPSRAREWDYPTRSDTAPSSEAPPGTDTVNGSANYMSGGLHVDPTYYRTEVGAYHTKPSYSAYGTFDQGGNVWEWNETFVETGFRGVRGGSFHDEHGEMLASHRFRYSPANEGSHIHCWPSYLYHR